MRNLLVLLALFSCLTINGYAQSSLSKTDILSAAAVNRIAWIGASSELDH